MNGRKAKRIRRHANQLVLEWLKTMLTDEEAKKLNPKNMDKYMPEQTHFFANRSFHLSAYTPRWFQQRIKRIVRKNKKAIEDITLQEIENACQLLDSSDRQAMAILLHQEESIDLIIPRGGQGLIQFVAENSRIPVIKHYKGVCHVYVDESADVDMATDIAVNAKTQRPGVCNAMETLLIDRAIAPTLLPPIAATLREKNVELRVDESAREIIGDGAVAASDADWDTEFLDLICAVRIVDGVGGALAHIHRHGSGHTEAIITENDGVVTFGKDTKGKRRIVVTAEDGTTDEYLIPKGKNITVNALAPGLIALPMNRVFTRDQDLRKAWNAGNLARRWGEPEDVAGVAVFLASGDAGFIIGETITVDGGSISALVRKGE